MHRSTVKTICFLTALVILMTLMAGCVVSPVASLQADPIFTEFAQRRASWSKTDNALLHDASRQNAPNYIISDIVLVDDDNCTFRIVKAYDGDWGFTLKVFCENKTIDKTLMFTLENVIVNGYMIDPFWAKEVLAGKKANSEISFFPTSFQEAGIDAADEISFTLKVYDSNDWLADNFVKENFTIYPTGMSAEEVVYPERAKTETEQIVSDNESVSFVILSAGNDTTEYILHCYLENKTDKTLMFSWDDVSVNGYMIDPYWAKEMAPKSRCYSDISFYKSDLESNDITVVEEIEYTLHVYDSDDWMADSIMKESFTYKTE